MLIIIDWLGEDADNGYCVENTDYWQLGRLLIIVNYGEDNDYSRLGDFADYWKCEECSDYWQCGEDDDY